MHNILNWSATETVTKLKSKDSQTLEALVRQYSSHLYNAAKGMRFSDQEAEDICSTTWMTFFDVVEKFEGRSHIRTYLFGIFYNKCKEWRRTEWKFESSDSIDQIVDSQFLENGHWKGQPHDPFAHSENLEFNRFFKECMNNLNDLMREVFRLKEVEQLESSEICHILQISDTNLRQVFSRSKNKLRNCLSLKLGIKE